MIGLKARFLPFVLLAMLIFATPVYGQNVNGRLNAEIIYSNETTEISTVRRGLANLIRNAAYLLGNTEVSATGAGLDENAFWATAQTHANLQGALQSAREIYAENAPVLAVGDTFYVAVSIRENTGFAGMFLRLHLPQGLEVVDVHAESGAAEGFTHGAEYAGWVRGENLTADGYLFTYTIRVTENATLGTSEPLKISFGSALPGAFDIPVDEHGGAVTISLPGGWTQRGTAAEIGRVIIG